MLRPHGAVNPVQTCEEKKPPKQGSSVPRVLFGPAPHQPSCRQADDTFEFGGAPMDGTEFWPGATLQVEGPNHSDGYRGDHRPAAALRGRGQIEDGNQEKEERRSVAQDDDDGELREVFGEEGDLGEGGTGETDPSDEPEAKVAGILVAAEEREKDEQNNRGGGLEERATEQALILQHVVCLPADLRSPQPRQRASGLNAAMRIGIGEPGVTLTCCFLNGQVPNRKAVTSHIMADGSAPLGNGKHSGR